jgi:hypothetical protein
MVYATWPKLLHEAKANATEILVLLALAQHPKRNGLLSRPVADYGAAQEGIATATGLSQAQVRNAIVGLTTKTFTDDDGKQVPILTRKVSAHRGKVAVFKCNLPSDVRHGGGQAQGDASKAEPTGDAEESATNQVHNNKEMCNQSGTSCATNTLHHLEKSGEAGSRPSHPPTLLR